MVADVLDSAGAIFTIASALVVVGGVGIAGARRWRNRPARAEANKTAQILTTLEGKKPTLLDPTPPPGLVKRVGNLETGLSQVVTMLKPNGGNTTNPGDVMQLISRQNEAIMRHLDITIEDHP